MISNAMGRCGQCGREITTGGCPWCGSVRVFNYPMSYANQGITDMLTRIAQLERDLSAARAEAARLRELLVEAIEDDECGDGFHAFSDNHDHDCNEIAWMRAVKAALEPR